LRVRVFGAGLLATSRNCNRFREQIAFDNSIGCRI
jgi:hypothetical protein